MRTLSMLEAINEALHQEMERDETVFVFGEDVAKQGGDFGATRGLWKKFGDKRVKDTPLSEAAIAGVANGAAMAGLRPVAEIMFGDFITECYDQIVNQTAKARYMYAGQFKMPLVIRTAVGAGMRAGPQHSQSIESWFVNVPGLFIVAPSTPYDAKGLLVSSIRDDNPVLFLEHKMLYNFKGEVPEEPYTVPIGKGEIKRPGKDVTLIAYMKTVHQALEAAVALEKEGISAEVLDLRTIAPYDKQMILDSLSKTKRAVVIHEAPKTGGLGAEISSFIHEQMFYDLEAPVVRVAGLDCPVPFNPRLEDYVVPGAADIAKAVKSLF